MILMVLCIFGLSILSAEGLGRGEPPEWLELRVVVLERGPDCSGVLGLDVLGFLGREILMDRRRELGVLGADFCVTFCGMWMVILEDLGLVVGVVGADVGAALALVILMGFRWLKGDSVLSLAARLLDAKDLA